ncbi:ferredoxin [Nocardia transvalensis]|uniref:ferredoxin n=1 Tax=Nocardia transvalensis TaxID=37333 RepID=UPI001895DF24|nr:ferredoxin [Nocardia transvalensis]MBF6330903.1 ferredoxin [Nocardia transvalensis]
MELKIDRDICIGAGMCVLLAPELFDQDADDGRVIPKTAATGAEQQAALAEAVDACPSGAIWLEAQS